MNQSCDSLWHELSFCFCWSFSYVILGCNMFIDDIRDILTTIFKKQMISCENIRAITIAWMITILCYLIVCICTFMVTDYFINKISHFYLPSMSPTYLHNKKRWYIRLSTDHPRGFYCCRKVIVIAFINLNKIKITADQTVCTLDESYALEPVMFYISYLQRFIFSC